MNIENIPVGLFILGTTLLVLACIEIGYRFASYVRNKRNAENDSLVGTISTSVLGLLAFILAFTFGIVTNRYDAKKMLVLEEANIIRTVWLRADFLPDTDRVISKDLIRKYVSSRIAAVQLKDASALKEQLLEAEQIQYQLWNIAVKNARVDMNSDVAAMYIDALNEMNNAHGSRVVVGIHARIPDGIWLLLALLICMGMISIGYVAGSASDAQRSWSFILLAIAFSLVIALVVMMDKPYSPLTPVSQYPLEFLMDYMDSGK